MKNLFFLLLFSGLCLSACKDDVLDFNYDPGRLHYDGPNLTAPFLPVGSSEAAAKFPAEILDLYRDREISAVQLSIYNIPDAFSLVLYGDGDDDTPGGVLYEEDIRAILEPNKWNTVSLPSSIQIPEDGDLWIAVRCTHPERLQVIGCDAGPSKENGDWLYEAGDGLWIPFLDRGGDDINWNIRAVID